MYTVSQPSGLSKAWEVDGMAKELILPESSTEERLFLLAGGEHAMLILMYVACQPGLRKKKHRKKNAGFSMVFQLENTKSHGTTLWFP